MSRGKSAPDITGQTFGRLTVIKRAGVSTDGHATWLCLCSCGNQTIASGTYLRRRITMSCGCLNKEINRTRVKTHGMKGTRLYSEWRGIKQRCLNENACNYHNYGGRGITVCPEWLDNFEAFRDWALTNGYRDNLTIDRKDSNGPYSPENCQWITHKEQQSNRSTNRLITYAGETKTMKKWSETTGIPYNTLRQRLNKGWDIGEALSKPVDKSKAHRKREI